MLGHIKGFTTLRKDDFWDPLDSYDQSYVAKLVVKDLRNNIFVNFGYITFFIIFIIVTTKTLINEWGSSSLKMSFGCLGVLVAITGIVLYVNAIIRTIFSMHKASDGKFVCAQVVVTDKTISQRFNSTIRTAWVRSASNPDITATLDLGSNTYNGIICERTAFLIMIEGESIGLVYSPIRLIYDDGIVVTERKIDQAYVGQKKQDALCETVLKSSNSALDVVESFRKDTLLNDIHAIITILLSLAFGICSVVYVLGYISKDLYGLVIAPSLCFPIAFMVGIPMYLVGQQINPFYFVTFLFSCVLEQLGLMFVTSNSSVLIRIIASLMMTTIMLVSVWFLEKDIIVLRKQIKNGLFRMQPVIIISKVSQYKRIHPAVFRYHTIVVENKSGYKFEVRISTRWYKLLNEGDTGMMLVPDNDENTRLFIK